MKRSFAFFGNLNIMRMRERIQATSRPSNTQLHHMISERRRREKLNENFQALRALLPPGTKVLIKKTLQTLPLFHVWYIPINALFLTWYNLLER